MTAKDLVIHFYTGAFRGSIAQPKAISNIIRARCDIKDLSFCEEIYASVSSTLLQSILLRGEERVRTVSERSLESFGIYYDCNVYTEKWNTNFIRGFADKFEIEALSDKSSFMIGKTLYGATEEYKSIHKIKDSNIGLSQQDLQSFFEISEQIPSKVYINSTGWNNENQDVNGLSLLIQLLPGVEKKYLDDLSQRLLSNEHFKQLHNEPLTENNFKEIFTGVDEEIGYRVLDYEFKCNCNKETIMKFMKNFEETDLMVMKKENQIIACSHCNEKYEVTSEEIYSLLK
jgi:redox-regulated HSP33 family molecular chaperone